jgi:ABC-2 type transport system ATP-binding protein
LTTGTTLPVALTAYALTLGPGGNSLVYTYDTRTTHQADSSDITHLLDAVEQAGLRFNDLDTRQNSLEEIFVNLVKK